MAAAERISKFHDDAIETLQQSKRTGVIQKIEGEISRLRTWIQKHQSESVPDTAKQQLLSTVELFHNFANDRTQSLQSEKSVTSVGNLVGDLVSDLLKIPEGKLITSKGKRRAMKWVSSGEQNRKSGNMKDEESLVTKWSVVDLDEESGTTTLMAIDGGNIKENFHVDDESKMDAIVALFVSGAGVIIELRGNGSVGDVCEDLD